MAKTAWHHCSSKALVRWAIISSNPGRLCATATRAIGNNGRQALRVTSALFWPMRNGTQPTSNTGRFVQYFEQIVDDCPLSFIGKNLYDTIIVYHQ